MWSGLGARFCIFFPKAGFGCLSWWVQRKLCALDVGYARQIMNGNPTTFSLCIFQRHPKHNDLKSLYLTFSLLPHPDHLDSPRLSKIEHILKCASLIQLCKGCGSFCCHRRSRNNVPIAPWTIGLVALDNRVGHDGTVWGEDFVLSDLSTFASKELGGYLDWY